jgi:adenylyltransferase/sulfurtransferase
MLAEIGTEGQSRIKASSVLVVGAGGLGCPVLQYLAASGVGRLGIVEFDTVDETNLQRQVLYGTLDIGKLKSIIARDRISHLNPFTEVTVFNLRLAKNNAEEICKDFDIIVDATDNLETRYAISDACAALGKPMVHGAIYRYEGQVAVFCMPGGPSYRYFNPEEKEKTMKNPAPASVGLLGVLPGITGTLMANEVLKIITKTGEILSGKMLFYNILRNTFRSINIIPPQ